MEDLNIVVSRNQYDRDYFECGIPTKKSMYTNYRWLPELTITLAYRIIKTAGIKDHETILDYGSAKGYLVYALRILDFEAYGCDISEYAISKTHEEVKDYNKLIDNENNLVPFEQTFDWIISKDVLEHIPYEKIDYVLTHFTQKTKKCFLTIPLAENKKYYISDYESDVTHIIRENALWWKEKFEHNGFEICSWSYDMSKIKESWKQYKKGNAYFILKNRFLLPDTKC